MTPETIAAIATTIFVMIGIVAMGYFAIKATEKRDAEPEDDA